MDTIFEGCAARGKSCPDFKRHFKTLAIFGVFLGFLKSSAAVPIETEIFASASLNPSNSENNICQTQGCVDTAKTFLKNMDRDVNPCDNFYKFACGGFINSTIIPGDRSGISTFTLLNNRLESQLRTIIEAPIEPNEIKPFQLAKNFYKSCMNVDEIEAQGLGPLRKMLNKLGGWPVIDGEQSANNNFDWKSSIIQIFNAGYEISYLISIIIFPDLMKTTKNSIYIDQQTFGLSKNYLTKGFDDPIVQAYYSYMVDLAVIMGAERDRATTELEEALEFEIKLCNMSMTTLERRNVSKFYNPMTVSALKKNYSGIPWDKYFETILPSPEAIADDEFVIIADPKYVAGIEQLMSITPKRTQANYVMWRIVAASAGYMNKAIRAREFAYQTVLKGVTEREPRSRECLDILAKQWSVSVGAMYARNYFDVEAKENAARMFKDVKKQLKKILRQVDWMDDGTRRRALKKLSVMSGVIAFSNELLDDKKLEEHYKNLELSGGNYLESFLNYTYYQAERGFSKLHEPAPREDWTRRNPAIVNAFYSGIDNSIELPAGILQSIFFSKDRPKYTNYGAIGFIVGHEITHGFDAMGSQFDEDGNVIDWWAKPTRERFVNRTRCMVHQYSNYIADDVGLHLDGEQILNEVIADNGGIKNAYFAYTNWASRHAPEQQMPGLPYTPRQMFWISAANTWCMKYTPSALRDFVRTEDHPPGEFRVVGPLANMQDFSKDFNCPLGSHMNPVEKCSVW